MSKRKTVTLIITMTWRKSRGYLTFAQKLENDWKRWTKTLLSCLTRTYKASYIKTNQNSHPGIYQLDLSCNGRYIRESKKKVLTRCTEHQKVRIKSNWKTPGTTEHTKECHGQFNWIYPKKNRHNIKTV